MDLWVRESEFELEQSWSDHLVMKPARGRSTPTAKNLWRLVKSPHTIKAAAPDLQNQSLLLSLNVAPVGEGGFDIR
jgi:hypothetical protein